MSELWSFALNAWRRPGVETVALRLQDDFSQSVGLLLAGLWLGDRGLVPDAALAGRLADLASDWEGRRLVPLRTLRRAAGAKPEWSEWKRLLQDAELEAERLMLCALDALVREYPLPVAEQSTRAWLLLLAPAAATCVEQSSLLAELVDAATGC